MNFSFFNSFQRVPGFLSGFHSKDWLVLGSGPSIGKLSDVINVSNYNVLCINNSISLVNSCDIALMRDPENFTKDNLLPEAHKARCLITAAGNGKLIEDMQMNLFHELTIPHVFFMQYHTDSVLFSGIPVLVSSSSSSLAFMLMGMWGVKRVFSLGLDGGVGRHPLLVNHPEFSTHDYNIHNEGCRLWCDSFKMEWIKL